jgi:hypothetical protein
MRSDVYLQPGERRSCIGCHEPLHSSPVTMVSNPGSPQQLIPGPKGSMPFDYPELIQPILDRSCVSCHDGSTSTTVTRSDSKGRIIDLRGQHSDQFSRSYQNLRPYLRWYEWGGESIQQSTTLPGRCGADESPLTAILDDPAHKDHVNLSDEDRRTIYLWLDANAMFFGDFRLLFGGKGNMISSSERL